jgi:hypothetical protein
MLAEPRRSALANLAAGSPDSAVGETRRHPGSAASPVPLPLRAGRANSPGPAPSASQPRSTSLSSFGRVSPTQIGDIAKAALVLTQIEHKMIS